MNINKLSGMQQSAAMYTKYPSAANEKTVSKTDTLELTQDARKFLDNKSNENEKYSTAMSELDMMRKQLEESDSGSDSFADTAKCLKIVRRIINGDKVPLKDRRFLAEKQPELYKNALIFQRQNPKPEKYKSCLDEDDEEEVCKNAVCAANTDEGGGKAADISIE